MVFKIGVMGSAIRERKTELYTRAKQIGEEIARQKCVLITGAAPGLPYQAVIGAYEIGGLCIGISPASDLTEHQEKFHFPTNYQILIFTGFGLKGRNVITIRSCDAVILIGGGIGTLNEFTIACSEKKLIGVLSESGGISEKLQEILNTTGLYPSIIYDLEPKALVQKIIEKLSEDPAFIIKHS